jgi:hypothetical protein
MLSRNSLNDLVGARGFACPERSEGNRKPSRPREAREWRDGMVGASGFEPETFAPKVSIEMVNGWFV